MFHRSHGQAPCTIQGNNGALQCWGLGVGHAGDAYRAGAGRTRVVRLLVVESLVLAIAGAALGIFLASVGLRALMAALPAYVIPSELVIALNAPVLAVTLGIAVLTPLTCGLAPELESLWRD